MAGTQSCACYSINLLNQNSMADENKTQTYVWPMELRENKITEQTDDYTASVKTFSDTKSLEYLFPVRSVPTVLWDEAT